MTKLEAALEWFSKRKFHLRNTSGVSPDGGEVVLTTSDGRNALEVQVCPSHLYVSFTFNRNTFQTVEWNEPQVVLHTMWHMLADPTGGHFRVAQDRADLYSEIKAAAGREWPQPVAGALRLVHELWAAVRDGAPDRAWHQARVGMRLLAEVGASEEDLVAAWRAQIVERVHNS